MKKILLIITVLSMILTGVSAYAQDYVLMIKGKKSEMLPSSPKKVVVMDYSSLDTMEELGVSAAVAAVPKMHLPHYLAGFKEKKYEDVGGVLDFDIEKIYRLSPDLIIISNRQSRLQEKLSRIAPTININIDNDRYTESFRRNTLLLGRIWNKEAQASQIVAEFDTESEKLKSEIAKLSGKGLISMHNAGKFSVYGSGSRFGIIHDVFGLKQADGNIQVSTHGKSVNSEYIAKVNPDYLFVVDRDSVVTGKVASVKEIENRLIRTTNAFHNGKIVYLPADYWYMANGGAKSMMLMIKDIRRIIS